MLHDPPAPPPHSSEDEIGINEMGGVCQQVDNNSGACHGSATDAVQAQPHPSLSGLGDGSDDTTPIDPEDTDGDVNMDATTTGDDDLTQDTGADVNTMLVRKSEREKKLTAPIINPALTVLALRKNKRKAKSTRKSTIHKRSISFGRDAEHPIQIDEFNGWDPIQWRDYKDVPETNLDTVEDGVLQVCDFSFQLLSILIMFSSELRVAPFISGTHTGTSTNGTRVSM
ncbi:hypothetical protein NLJ89_g12260 [Agrocybe chaxingu]|uniref:Uncharacterized protein n=1 Tax=Agrocybe chaxingu TaxID=84603 RepID=A0A9W8JQU5_9AGAR|nr:hypothetical protein NLJ89_g12260 [Agrocybe chaxingu]